jgi:hypothetical protein
MANWYIIKWHLVPGYISPLSWPSHHHLATILEVPQIGTQSWKVGMKGNGKYHKIEKRSPVPCRVMRFFLFERMANLVWHFKLYVEFLQVRVWDRFFQNLNPLISVISHFFKFKNLCTWFLDWVKFHVHDAHYPMLKIMWV